MARLALPSDQADARNRELHRQASIAQARFEIAKEVMGAIMAVEYHRGLVAAARESDPYGTGGDSDSQKVELQIEAGTAAYIAAASADSLLEALGIIQPSARPKPNDGPL